MRVGEIESPFSDWQTDVVPLHYTRKKRNGPCGPFRDFLGTNQIVKDRKFRMYPIQHQHPMASGSYSLTISQEHQAGIELAFLDYETSVLPLDDWCLPLVRSLVQSLSLISLSSFALNLSRVFTHL